MDHHDIKALLDQDNIKSVLEQRQVKAVLLAIVITIVLVFMMHLLIRMAQPELNKSEAFVLPKFVHVPEPDELNVISPPPKPPKVQDQPDTPEPEVEPEPVVNNIDVKLSAGLSINRSNKLGLAPGDGEYLPIVKIAPVYPARAAERCLEGHVIVAFTVTATGSVRDPFVVESTSSIFNSSAKRAASKFKYKPRTVDGVPVEVPNVKNKITYEMGEGCN